MGKLKKLIFNPKKFIKDSLWFKQEKLNIKASENLFVISHLGQLNQVEALIKYETISNASLAILYTEKNLTVPNSILEQVDKSLFIDCFLFKLPISPNNYNLKSLVYINRNYKILLNNVNPENLYLLSFENHYSLLAKKAKEKKINLNLIDEGTATYKNKYESEYFIKNISFIKQILAKFFGVNYAFDWYIDFDKVYAAFPELLKKTFNAKEYIRFFAHAENFEIDALIYSLIKKYNITSNDFLYVNQRYAIQNKDFVGAILTILDEISKHYNAKVFIKMHPKDHDSLKNEFKKKLIDFSNIVFIEENEFLIEPTIQFVKPKGVIGLTSTSLVYTPLVSPSTRVYSIAPWFLSLIPLFKNQDGIEIIQNHFKILKKFKHIVILNAIQDLNKCYFN